MTIKMEIIFIDDSKRSASDLINNFCGCHNVTKDNLIEFKFITECERPAVRIIYDDNG